MCNLKFICYIKKMFYNITTKSLRTCRYLIGYPTNNLTNVEHRESRIP